MNPKAWHKAQPSEEMYETICISLVIQDTAPGQESSSEEQVHTNGQGCNTDMTETKF